MAKVTGPLFSINASGQFADSLVFSNWKGINIVKKKGSPTGESSAQQNLVKSAFAECAKVWNALNEEEKEMWNEI
ncbi:MAG: hypothetical protein ACQEQF_09540 [Bacillota bacterium]